MDPEAPVSGRIIRQLVLFAAVALLLPASAHAGFPGDNGKIAFSSNRDDPDPSGCGNGCNYEIYTMNPDGTGETRLTFSQDSSEDDPAWSPDGRKIAFTKRTPGHFEEVWVMNADGSGQAFLNYWGQEPAWSPDGRLIVFVRAPHEGLYRMNADGTGEQSLGASGDGEPTDPAWSPDGSKIAWVSVRLDCHLFTVNPDGSGETNLTPAGSAYCDVTPDWAPDSSKIAFSGYAPEGIGIKTMNSDGSARAFITDGDHPAWSPDGQRFVFTRGPGTFPLNDEIWVSNSDGSGETQITTNSAHDSDPNWQPLKPPGYARPQTASPMTFRLVPSHKSCTSPNAEHGAPLVAGSCSPAEPASNFLTIGTPDVNGNQSRSTGLLKMNVLTESPIDLTNGDQSDVEFTVRLTDVRDKQTLADYTGELKAVFTLMLTDFYNGPGGVHPATAETTLFSFTFACTPTEGPPDVGSTCSTLTTADAIMPGVTPEKKRAIWRIGKVAITDGGSDGDADTPGNTGFATQGLYAP